MEDIPEATRLCDSNVLGFQGAKVFWRFFGRLINANSPAALQRRFELEVGVWHEYCHVVTLQENKESNARVGSSEGISVYEELQKNKSWGQSMDPTYRDDYSVMTFSPQSMSGAFLSQGRPFICSLPTLSRPWLSEFFIAEFGMPALQKLLDDLSIGMPIQDALSSRSGDPWKHSTKNSKIMPKRGKQISERSRLEPPRERRQRDCSLGPPQSECLLVDRESLQSSDEKKSWGEALPLAASICAMLGHDDHRNDGAYGMLAEIYREQKRPELERLVLVSLVERSSDAVEALERLSELEQLCPIGELWPIGAKGCNPFNPSVSSCSKREHKRTKKQGRWGSLLGLGERVSISIPRPSMDPLQNRDE